MNLMIVKKEGMQKKPMEYNPRIIKLKKKTKFKKQYLLQKNFLEEQIEGN